MLTTNSNTLPDGDRLIVLPQVLELVPYSATHIWRLEQTGAFPRRIKLGPNKVAWSLREVEAWVETKKQARIEVLGHQDAA